MTFGSFVRCTFVLIISWHFKFDCFVVFVITFSLKFDHVFEDCAISAQLRFMFTDEMRSCCRYDDTLLLNVEFVAMYTEKRVNTGCIFNDNHL